MSESLSASSPASAILPPSVTGASGQRGAVTPTPPVPLEESGRPGRSPRPRARRRLSSRRVRGLLPLSQRWRESSTGALWTVRQIHRKDKLVALQGPGCRPRYVEFADLGKDYRLLIERER